MPLSTATRTLNSWLEVDLDALRANVHALRAAVGPGVELIAVVKANAYGAGVEGVVPALEAAGVERFAVVLVAEALALREIGVRRPILVLGHAHPGEASRAVVHNITLTLDSLELARALSAAATVRLAAARVHVHVDSGLHRDGVTLNEAVSIAEAARQLPGLVVEGLSTHMANADEADDSYSDEQHALFAEAARRLPWVVYRHAANSASALRRPELRYAGVRVGLALHGVVPNNAPDPGVRPVLSLRARLARVSDVPTGEGVSYGLTWRAARPSRVGLVPVGYADGWRRSLGNCGEVLVGGRRCPIVGRVCMDQFVCDVTDVPGAAVGDEVVLLGGQGSEQITADEVARSAGTIPWDVLASLQGRLPRLFVRGGVVEQVSGRT
ncbi:MAG: alanine racemase [Dehalococcoidia bacterium]|nr:alanine racemase [Dehalococcoidia bacterium]